MNKVTLSLLGIVVAAFLFTGCKKDEKKGVEASI